MPTCVPWIMETACCDGWDAVEPELQERAETLAWATLRALSGGRLGACPVTMRPCLSAPCEVCCDWWNGWMRPTVVAGEWVNCACGSPECSCEQMCEIVTPGPIAALLAVTLDGAEVPLDAFRVDNGNRIVRQDGECWPSCQNMGAALGEAGTLGISYVPGIVPDEAGLWAAGVLACEFSKACTGAKCRLPSSVTSIARQGVSFTMSGGMFENGMTGIREVDAYLTAINPHALLSPSLVWSPDMGSQKHRYQTTVAEVTP
jgi:hypothetical protein